MITKIVSGGQTGVDQAALDAAMVCKVAYGGWLPDKRMTEDGPLDARYTMDILKGGSYPDRTKKNVEDSDATLIISRGVMSGGTRLTYTIAKARNKPVLHIDVGRMATAEASQKIVEWLTYHKPEVLNVAGPRASSDPAIYQNAHLLLCTVFKSVVP